MTWRRRSSCAAAGSLRMSTCFMPATWGNPTCLQDGPGRINNPERLVFLDECGVQTNMARLWGSGQRACGTVPCGTWKRLTLLGALGIGGMVAAMSVEATT